MSAILEAVQILGIKLPRLDMLGGNGEPVYCPVIDTSSP